MGTFVEGEGYVNSKGVNPGKRKRGKSMVFKCHLCEKEARQTPSVYKLYTLHFCGQDCARTWYKKNPPRHQTPPVLLTCIICGTQKHFRPSREPKYPACDNPICKKAVRKMISTKGGYAAIGRRGKADAIGYSTCDYCGEEIMREKKELDKYSLHFCGAEHQQKFYADGAKLRREINKNIDKFTIKMLAHQRAKREKGE